MLYEWTLGVEQFENAICINLAVLICTYLIMIRSDQSFFFKQTEDLQCHSTIVMVILFFSHRFNKNMPFVKIDHKKLRGWPGLFNLLNLCNRVPLLETSSKRLCVRIVSIVSVSKCSYMLEK